MENLDLNLMFYLVLGVFGVLQILLLVILLTKKHSGDAEEIRGEISRLRTEINGIFGQFSRTFNGQQENIRQTVEKKLSDIQRDNSIEAISNKTKDKDVIIATEVGQHQMWTAQLYKFSKPRQLITSGGLGTMGFGFPAAIGAQIAAPEKLVFNIAGDGSIQMNIQELMTCVDYKIPVKIAVINNGYLGMVRQWQEKLFDKHYSQTPITSPDYVKLAEAYGVLGIRVTKEEEIEPALEKAIAYDGPVILDFVVEPFEMVYPWVLAGKPLNEVLLSNETGKDA